jgi:leucyl/phenylalanyl-tRNA---protein transferase
MPVFRLTRTLVFPPPSLAEPDGLLAVGGDLSPGRILLAYELGIFPWYSEEMPILWWSPDPRLVLFPDEFKVSRSLKRVLKKGVFEVTIDRAFRKVIVGCAEVRRTRGEGTWITGAMVEAYTRLHEMGYAHSVESWFEGELAGGLYGIGLGRAFFGESMFARRTDASKVALAHLVALVKERGFELIDCQQSTEHLKSFGAREIPRAEFLRLLDKAVKPESGEGGLWNPRDPVSTGRFWSDSFGSGGGLSLL